MRFAVLLALMVLTAGCLGGADTNPKNDPRPDPGPDPDPDPGPGPDPANPGVIVLLAQFQFQGCSGIEARYFVAAADAQAMLPDGFTVRDDQGPNGNEALARYRLFECEQFGSASAVVNDTIYGDVSLMIEDPEIHETGEGLWYRMRIFAADDVLAQAWNIVEYDVVSGEMTRSSSPGLDPVTQHTLSFEGYQAQWIASIEDGVLEEEVSFTQTPNGTVVWGEVVDELDSVKLGIGSFSVPAGDPLRALLSDEPGRGELLSHSDTDILQAELVLVTSS